MLLICRAIRTRATRFVKEFAQAHNEVANAKPFWMKFFEVFGIQARTVSSYEVQGKDLVPACLAQLVRCHQNVSRAAPRR